MLKPSVEPNVISLRTSPGEVGSATVKLDRAPSAANLTASVADGGSLVRVKRVVVYDLRERPLTDDEIEELPLFPPSFRKNAGKLRIRALVETGRSDGSTPLRVPAGAAVSVELEFSPPAQQPAGLTAATLVVEGTAWELIEVPLYLFVGEATILPTVEPHGFQLGLKPGETRTVGVNAIGSGETGSTVVGYVVNGGSAIRVKGLILFKPVKKHYTEEEIAEMPQELREAASRRGYVAYEETGRVNDGAPIGVPPNCKLRLTLEFTAPLEQPPDFVSATLVLEGTTWKRAEFPLYLAIREFIIAVTPRALTVRQGEDAELQLQVTSVVGPPADVNFTLAQFTDAGGWRFAPAVVHVGRRDFVSLPAQIIVESRAPRGTTSVALIVDTSDGILLEDKPVVLTILPGLMTVNLVQTALTAMQGDEVAADVFISTKGGTAVVTFSAGPLPPGVALLPSGAILTPGGSTTTSLRFHIDPLAKSVAGFPVTVFWAADDGANHGALTLSLTILLRPESKSFGQSVVTPAGTALGGNVSMTLHNDGNFVFQGHMHDSGFPSYKFRVRAAVRSASGKVVVVGQKSGDVEGTEVELIPFNDARRDFDWSEPGTAPNVMQKIRDYWPDISSGTMTVSKSYELAGVLGGAVGLAKDLLGFVVADVLFGPQLALVISVGAELSSITNASFVGPGGLVGVTVAGGVVWLFGPGMVGAAVVAGVAAGAVADALIRHRPLSSSEHNFASEKVFGDTLPPAERIILTNLSHDNGRKFTWPSIDGTILLNLGDAFDDPLGHTELAYPKPGQVLIHELTHAWQIHNTSFLPGLICNGAFDGKDYSYGPPYLTAGMTLPPFGSYGVEQQAAIVDQWFGGTRPSSSGIQMDQDDPYFGYILNNIQLGQL